MPRPPMPPPPSLSPDESVEAMQQWAMACGQVGYATPRMLVRAILFLRDSNRLTSPLPKAERVQLCLEQMERAHEAAVKAGEREMAELCYDAIERLMPEYRRQMVRCLNIWQERQVALYEAATTGRRRLAVAQKSADELKKRLGSYLIREPAYQLELDIARYWTDQLILTRQYGPS